MPKLLFLDTMVFLHYQDFDQINWPEVAQADAVTIVIPPVTIRELNKHKESHPRPRVRRRAGTTLRKLSALLGSGLEAPLQDWVVVQLEDRDPLIDFTAHHLSPQIQDDQLIASIIMRRNESPRLPIVLVTSDVGLTLLAKANRLGIDTTRLSDDLKLPEEIDADQERIRELERQIRELKLVTPQLSLTFEDGSQHATFTLPRPIGLTPEEAERKLDDLKRRYSKMQEQPKGAGQSDNATNLTVADLATGAHMAFLNAVMPEEIERYNTDLDKFYQAYASHLQNSVKFQNLRGRTIVLAIWLANDGTAPAEDIDVFMQFPDGFVLRSHDDFPEPPEPAKPPAPARTAIQKMMEPITGLSSFPYLGPFTPEPVFPPPNVSSPRITRASSYDVDLHVQRLKHKLREPFDALYATFESLEAAHSFHIDYQILAANLPDEASGTLHVRLETAE